MSRPRLTYVPAMNPTAVTVRTKRVFMNQGRNITPIPMLNLLPGAEGLTSSSKSWTGGRIPKIDVDITGKLEI